MNSDFGDMRTPEKSTGQTGSIPVGHDVPRLFDHKATFYEQTFFQYMLACERKRTERSRKPFMLMIIDVQELLAERNDIRMLNRIIQAISTSTREVDIKGWYKQTRVIGIIFTEINHIAKDLMKAKIIGNLGLHLDNSLIKLMSISCHIFPESHDKDNGDGHEIDSKLYPDMSKKNTKKRKRYMKRAIDIAGSIFCILLFSPLFLIIPVLIKSTSKGRVFFKQERTGRLGKRFVFLKFRTMHESQDESLHENYVKDFIKNSKSDNDDKNGEQKIYKMNNDPRVTPLGHFLRKTSLDELPQFFNVLKGEMSLVGPRPPIPYELRHYDIWHRSRVLQAKPGITGIWQVEGRSLVTFDEMVRMDLEYINKWSLFLDIKILIKTPFAILSFKGAY